MSWKNKSRKKKIRGRNGKKTKRNKRPSRSSLYSISMARLPILRVERRRKRAKTFITHTVTAPANSITTIRRHPIKQQRRLHPRRSALDHRGGSSPSQRRSEVAKDIIQHLHLLLQDIKRKRKLRKGTKERIILLRARPLANVPLHNTHNNQHLRSIIGSELRHRA